MERPFLKGCVWGFVSGCFTACAVPVVGSLLAVAVSAVLGIALVSLVVEVVTDPEFQAALEDFADEVERASLAEAEDERLEEAVLEACGGWGGGISRDEAEYILLLWNRQLPATGGRSWDFDRVVAQWTAADGMTHIFCGHPSIEGVGGLHYEARIDQAVNEAWLIPDPLCDQDDRGDLVRTGFVSIYHGSLGTACPKSYVRGLNASDILELTTVGALTTWDGQCRVRIPGRGLHWKVTMRSGAIRSAWPIVDDPRLPYCGE